MKRNRFRGSTMAVMLAAGCFFCGTGISAAAYTVDEVAQKAREVGYSEEMVQMGYNEWASGSYTQADLDSAYAQLCDYDNKADDKINEIFGNTDTSESSASSETDSTDSSTEAAVSDAQTTRPSSAEFINMTLDEKIAYVNTMSEQEKNTFLSSLTTEERNSIIKQMSVSDKAELMQGYIDAADAMGMNVVVDSISDSSVSLTVRNQDGVVIDKTAVGVTIDETGISHTGLLALAGGGVLAAAAGFALICRYIRRLDSRMQ